MVKRLSWLLLLAIPALAILSLSMSAAHVRHETSRAGLDPSCSTSTPCIEYQNTSSGPGVEGTSNSGFGLEGVSSSSAGLRGITTSGNGVYGSSSVTNSSGIFGSSTGNGVRGLTTNKSLTTKVAKYGVFGNDGSTDGGTLNGGVLGQSTNGTGVEGTSSVEAGVYGISNNGAAVASQEGTKLAPNLRYISGLNAVSSDGPGVSASSDASGGEALLADSFNGGPIMIGSNGNTDEMSLDASGNMILAGTLMTMGTPLVVTRTASGQSLGTYTPQQSAPTLEDFGEAQLVGGVAFVHIDPKFTAAMDSKQSYLVFVTPQGDSHGLYVTQKSPTAFTVRENMNGRSSLAFDYRIVAKPYGARRERLPLASELPHLGIERILPVRTR